MEKNNVTLILVRIFGWNQLFSVCLKITCMCLSSLWCGHDSQNIPNRANICSRNVRCRPNVLNILSKSSNSANVELRLFGSCTASVWLRLLCRWEDTNKWNFRMLFSLDTMSISFFALGFNSIRERKKKVRHQFWNFVAHR